MVHARFVVVVVVVLSVVTFTVAGKFQIFVLGAEGVGAMDGPFIRVVFIYFRGKEKRD